MQDIPVLPSLFSPLQIGDWQLRNRIIMAPLTRCRSSEGRIPNALMAEYYRQRASAGLIISEATSVDPMGVGYPRTPGLWSEEQVAGWRKVTDAVHCEGGLIIAQLWHVGRVSDPVYLDGRLPVAPSALAPGGHVSLVRPKRNYVTPRALLTEEISAIVEAYRKSAQNALRAGFDGVELHGANGYLLDQFLQDGSNHRTDAYGGTVENRARLMFEAVDAAVSVWGAGRVGLHLAPRADSYDMGDSDLKGTFSYVASEAGKRKLAFLFTRESQVEPRLSPLMKQIFGGVMIANEALDLAAAQHLLQAGEADAVSWGKWFISNPDLPARLASGAPLNELDVETLHLGDAKGYTDYPFAAS